MKCELDRLVLLARNSIYPLPYHIPRRVLNLNLITFKTLTFSEYSFVIS